MRPIVLLALVFALSPGSGLSAERIISLDDESSVRLWVFKPQISEDEPPWPLAMLIPAGEGQEFIVRAQFGLGKELTDRGWAIAVPLSRDGEPFFREDDRRVDELVEKLQEDPEIHNGKILLVGVSQGGSSALEIASLNPSKYLGVIAVPGRLKNQDELPPLGGLPVFLRIADRDDFRWNRQITEIIQRLETAGAEVNAALVPDATHIFKIDWDEIDSWLHVIK